MLILKLVATKILYDSPLNTAVAHEIIPNSKTILYTESKEKQQVIINLWLLRVNVTCAFLC